MSNGAQFKIQHTQPQNSSAVNMELEWKWTICTDHDMKSCHPWWWCQTKSIGSLLFFCQCVELEMLFLHPYVQIFGVLKWNGCTGLWNQLSVTNLCSSDHTEHLNLRKPNRKHTRQRPQDKYLEKFPSVLPTLQVYSKNRFVCCPFCLTSELYAILTKLALKLANVYGCIFLNAQFSDVNSSSGRRLQKRGGGGGFGYQKSKNVQKSRIFKQINKKRTDGRQFSRWCTYSVFFEMAFRRELHDKELFQCIIKLYCPDVGLKKSRERNFCIKILSSKWTHNLS